MRMGRLLQVAISFWALQRDNGRWAGAKGNDGCSGVKQTTWPFSHDGEPFTRA